MKKGNFSKWTEIEPIVKHYFAGISHIDYQIGRLIEFLKEKNMYDNTVIIFSSDHGESLGIHDGLCDKAIFMYEETCSIPLIFKDTKNKQAQRISEFANSCDIYSTILDYAGVDTSLQKKDGQSLRPLMENVPVEWPETVVTECSGIGSLLFSQRMIRKDNIKYIFNCGDVDELYDLASDPHELINCIQQKEYEEIVKDMKHAMHEWMSKYNDNIIFEFEQLRLKNTR